MPTYRIIIAGGRHFLDAHLVQEKCTPIIQDLRNKGFKIEIVSGHASGADTLGEFYAESRQIPVKLFPAEWSKYGKRAGFLRNEQMADYAKEQGYGGLIAFWDGKSPGTKSMIELAKRKGLEVLVVNY